MVDIPKSITSSAVGLKTCTMAAGIKRYKSIIKNIEKSTTI